MQRAEALDDDKLKEKEALIQQAWYLWSKQCHFALGNSNFPMDN